MAETAVAALTAWIAARRPRTGTLIVGIDGAGAAGKSTLAAAVAQQTGAGVVAMDDFFRPGRERLPQVADAWGGEFDADRLRVEVLEPLAATGAAAYGVYDWGGDRVTPAAASVRGPVVIVEGVYVLQPALRRFYGLTVWVDAPRDERLRRGLERDGEGERPTWEKQWMPQEDRYLEAADPRDGADAVLDAATEPTRVIRAPVMFAPPGGPGTA